MAEQAMSMARTHAPWRAGSPWWVSGIQAIVLVVIGLYLLLAPASAAGLIIQLIALILLIESVLHIIAELRSPRAEPFVPPSLPGAGGESLVITPTPPPVAAGPYLAV